jgi:hypothetical protein
VRKSGVKRWGEIERAGIGLVTLSVVSCTTSRMAPPADVAIGAEVLEVKDRSGAAGTNVDESFRLGRYFVTEIDREWDSNDGFHVGKYGEGKPTRGFRFQLKGGNKTLDGTCATEQVEQPLLPIEAGVDWSSATVACRCEGDGQKAELVISAKRNRMVIETQIYQLRPVYSQEDGTEGSDPVGFRADADGPFAAAEVVFPGRIWMKEDQPPSVHAKMSCLFAGLMLHEPGSLK